MLPATVIGFLVAISAFAWFYNYFMRTTGQNTQKAITGAGSIAVLAFIIMLIILFFIDRSLEGADFLSS